MCIDPLSLSAGTTFAIETGLGVAQAGAGFIGQMQQYNQQVSYNEQMYRNIEADRENKMQQAANQEDLINHQAYDKLNENAKSMNAAIATAQTAAGEAGVNGLSVAALTHEYYQRGSDYADSVERNRQADVDRLQLQMKGFDVAAQNEQNRLPVPVAPSFLDAALRIGGSTVSAYKNTLYVPPEPRGVNNSDTGSE